MTKNKVVSKIMFNLATISNTLLAGIILTNNYHLTPDTLILSATSIATNGYFLNKSLSKKRVKSPQKTLKK